MRAAYSSAAVSERDSAVSASDVPGSVSGAFRAFSNFAEISARSAEDSCIAGAVTSLQNKPYAAECAVSSRAAVTAAAADILRFIVSPFEPQALEIPDVKPYLLEQPFNVAAVLIV